VVGTEEEEEGDGAMRRDGERAIKASKKHTQV
jgi:hypothetical protein